MLMTGLQRSPFNYDFPIHCLSICPKLGKAHSPLWSGGATGVQVKTFKKKKNPLNNTSLRGHLKQPGMSRPSTCSRRPRGEASQGPRPKAWQPLHRKASCSCSYSCPAPLLLSCSPLTGGGRHGLEERRKSPP